MKTPILSGVEGLEATDIKSKTGRSKLMIYRAAFMSELKKGEDSTIGAFMSYQDEPEDAQVGAVAQTGSIVHGVVPMPWVVVRVERSVCEPGSVYSDIYLLWCRRMTDENKAELIELMLKAKRKAMAKQKLAS